MMKCIILFNRPSMLIKTYRCISINLWRDELTNEIRKEIEEYWIKKFKYYDNFNKENLKEKYYALSMFPYPSGSLHLGHVRVYAICDTVAQFQRMNGKNVFQPMGWDSFGLPAENAAKERGVRPNEWTQNNISQMKNLLERLKCTFDWQNELNTCSPEYYRWTQYIFLKMYDAGLVYQKEDVVNWDPVDKTVLADEQVDEEGKSWRSGVKVQKKVLKQWFIRTTKFSQDLYEGLNIETLDWDDIIDIQKNWIGKCDGFSFDFKIESPEGISETSCLNIWVQDPLHILEAEFIVVLPNTLMDILCDHKRDTNGKLKLRAFNPFTNRSLPVYVSEKVPFPFSRDTYVGVPSKSEFDREFIKNMQLEPMPKVKSWDRKEICETAKKLRIGGYPVSSKIKDWLISRQRYWGTPIPIVHCSKCGTQPVRYEDLPVKLPMLPSNCNIEKDVNMFLKKSDWQNTICSKCGGEALKETDTMDTFVDSSWYYLRYTDVNNEKELFNSDVINQFMPVDLYVGGKEHAVLHLYYARFVSYFLHSIGLIQHREPFRRLLCQGMVKGKTYKTKKGKYLKPEEIEFENETPKSKTTGEVLTVTWEKMSKSKYNGVEPIEVLNTYGIDTTRLLLLFSVSPKSHRNWNSDYFVDVLKWQHRLWLTIREFLKIRTNPLDGLQPCINMEKENAALKYDRNRYIRGVTYNFGISQQLAAGISYLQGLTNVLRRPKREVRKYSKEYEKVLAATIIMLAPVTPHFAATLWFGFTSAPGRLNTDCHEINWNENVLKQKWPTIDGEYEVPLYCKINRIINIEAKIPSNKIASLTLEESLKYAQKNSYIKKTLKNQQILDAKLKMFDNLCVELSLLTNKVDTLEKKIIE